jgi:hypothetical protein
MARHYVYRYALETESGEVIDLYVGHGTGNRAVVHLDRSHNPRLRGMIDWALAEGLGAGCRLVVGILGTHRSGGGGGVQGCVRTSMSWSRGSAAAT